jgi:hypothetical protein
MIENASTKLTRRGLLALAAAGSAGLQSGCGVYCYVFPTEFLSEEEERELRHLSKIRTDEAKKQWLDLLETGRERCLEHLKALPVFARSEDAAFVELDIVPEVTIIQAVVAAPTRVGNPPSRPLYMLEALGPQRLLFYDQTRGEVASQIQLVPGTATTFEGFLAITPDGRTLIATAAGEQPQITFIDALQRRELGRISLTGRFPAAVAASPDGAFAYVAAFDGSGPFGGTAAMVLVINLASRGVEAEISLPGPSPDVQKLPDIAVSPDGGQVFVLSRMTPASIHVIDVRTRTLAASVATSQSAKRLAVNPDSSRLYVYPTSVPVQPGVPFATILDVLDAATLTRLTRVFFTPSTAGADLLIDPSEPSIFAASTDTIWEVDTNSNEIVAEYASEPTINHLLLA